MNSAAPQSGIPQIDKGIEDFIKGWYKTISGTDGRAFDDKYSEFMGDKQAKKGNEGHNRQIIREFIEQKDFQPLATYLLILYHHTVYGERSSTESVLWRIAAFIALTGLAIVLFLEYWGKRLEGNQWSIGFGVLFVVLAIIILFWYRTLGKSQFIRKWIRRFGGT